MHVAFEFQMEYHQKTYLQYVVILVKIHHNIGNNICVNVCILYSFLELKYTLLSQYTYIAINK